MNHDGSNRKLFCWNQRSKLVLIFGSIKYRFQICTVFTGCSKWIWLVLQFLYITIEHYKHRKIRLCKSFAHALFTEWCSRHYSNVLVFLFAVYVRVDKEHVRTETFKFSSFSWTEWGFSTAVLHWLNRGEWGKCVFLCENKDCNWPSIFFLILFLLTSTGLNA